MINQNNVRFANIQMHINTQPRRGEDTLIAKVHVQARVNFPSDTSIEHYFLAL